MQAQMDPLVNALRRGDPDARERIAEALYPKVRQIVHGKLQADFRRNHGWMFAEFSTGDIVQDVFLRIVDSLDRFRGQDDLALTSYLAASVHNRLLDMLRYHGAARRDVRKRVRETADEDQTVELAIDRCGTLGTPSRHLVAREHLQIYRVVLQGFEPRQRNLLTMRLEDGLAFDEIAERLEYANANVACKAYHSALARLLVRLRSRGVQPSRIDP